MDERMREAKRLPYGMNEAKGAKTMDDMKFKTLVNKVAEACKACTDKEHDCDMCPYTTGCVPRKDKDTIKVLQEYQERLEEQNPTQALGIKGKRDEALMNLYKRYNRLTALDKIGYAESEAMRDLIVDIEKLEHARHMEASDEIAKMSIEKLEKLAAPIPEMRMSGIPKEVREVLDKCEKKEGAENDD